MAALGITGTVVVKTKLLINNEVYVMNADGSSQVRLTNVMGNDDSPVWLPDGTKIVFRSDRDRNCCDPVAQIWIMNADGSNQINLSNNSFGDYLSESVALNMTQMLRRTNSHQGKSGASMYSIRHGLPPGAIGSDQCQRPP